MEGLKVELERIVLFEKEVKEKNFLIGKLWYEVIVLNDYFIKVLWYFKKIKLEDNVDRFVYLNVF